MIKGTRPHIQRRPCSPVYQGCSRGDQLAQTNPRQNGGILDNDKIDRLDGNGGPHNACTRDDNGLACFGKNDDGPGHFRSKLKRGHRIDVGYHHGAKGITKNYFGHLYRVSGALCRQRTAHKWFGAEEHAVQKHIQMIGFR